MNRVVIVIKIQLNKKLNVHARTYQDDELLSKFEIIPQFWIFNLQTSEILRMFTSPKNEFPY